MENKKLKIGKLASISKFNISEVDYLRGVNEFEGLIIGVDSNRIELEIIHPNLDLKEIAFIKLKTLLTLSFKEDDGLYQLPVEVDGFKGATVLIIIQKGPLNKIQRRKAIRIPIKQHIKYKKSQQEEFKDGKLQDISFIGAKIQVDSLKKIKTGDHINLQLDLPCFKEKTSLKGKVVRIETTKEGLYNLGLQFVDLSNNIKQKLARWIIQKQG
ncbi:flagellar brake protein [Halonatronum saccharophilum]|uniref:flagellar brake protein n=1 Tax=Halonatronum saccharophilum TaxID=150060 RepID=UPI0004847A36|nr:PilZ domain-containing protein [Halonatronum saccharophilum]